MARKVSSKPDSGNSTTTIRFESGIRSFGIRHSGLIIGPARRLGVMNLDLRGIEADFGHEHANTLHADLHPELCDEYVLANSPFKDSDWFRKDDDVRCICCDVILPMSGGIAA